MATSIAKYSPNAYVLIISNPVNSTVPIVAEVLKKHGKAYCIRHKKGLTDPAISHPAGCKAVTVSNSNASQPLPVPVASESSIMPVSDRPAGSNVTQNISCATAEDNAAIEATFDKTGL